MNCTSCHSKCKALCCSFTTPLPKQIFESNSVKYQSKIDRVDQISNDHVIVLTDSQYCVFLTTNFSCAIYDKRPELCKKFGDETDILMTCSYQSKNGEIRSRQQTRYLDAQKHKLITCRIKKIK